MPHWLLKSAIHRGISLLPRRQFWNEILQTRFSKSLDLTAASLEGKLTDFCRRYYESLAATRGKSPSEFDVVELGTGWFPVIPVGLFLCGARNIWTFDIESLLQGARLGRMLDCFAELARDGRLAKALPALQPQRLEQLLALRPHADQESPTEVLARINIRVHVGDARRTNLPAGCADLVFSWGVLEHIPRPALEELLREFRRVLRPDGVMTHYLYFGDQYSYFDRSITQFNNLRYSEKTWRRFDSPLIPQNRLRISDFRQLFAAEGFAIVSEDNRSGTLADLEKVPLAPEFRHYQADDLRVLFSFMVMHPTSG